ncbi:MAG: hypothetical protein QG670_1310 [Thermoproteota archaeon]|nr:hypothetical protein [Thermoproteota archaeon]
MSNEIVKGTTSAVMSELQNSHQLCQMLMKTPHYAKMGAEGIFAIVETAKSLNVDPRQALGGGLYYVKGKVEMSARMMNSLIRAQHHSITRDRKSDDTICILHGKRADNGDTWTESFSLEDAKRAGLTNSPVWKNFTRDMLFARALSRLARQLFPDIIGNVYVEGEISLDPNIRSTAEPAYVEAQPEPKAGVLPAEAQELDEIIGEDEEYRQSVLKFLVKNCGVNAFNEMPRDIYEKVKVRALKNQKDREEKRNLYAEELNTYGELSQIGGK